MPRWPCCWLLPSAATTEQQLPWQQLLWSRVGRWLSRGAAAGSGEAQLSTPPAYLPPWLQVQELIARGNRLAGPAFPPDWLLPGSLLGLRVLLLGGNPGLTGTLPASLDWPILTDL